MCVCVCVCVCVYIRLLDFVTGIFYGHLLNLLINFRVKLWCALPHKEAYIKPNWGEGKDGEKLPSGYGFRFGVETFQSETETAAAQHGGCAE